MRTLHLSEPPLVGSQPGVDPPNVKVLKFREAVGRLTWNIFRLTDWPSITVWTQHPPTKYQQGILMETH